MTVLDLGGEPQAWKDAPVLPEHVVCVNLLDFTPVATDDISAVIADALDMPASVLNQKFDLVYSNSLIEHVGGAEQRRRLAAIITEVGTHHWVQAPYRYFPIEPHWVFPFFQFLPLSVKATISRHWDMGGYSSRGNKESAVDLALEVDLPSITDFRYLFPSSDIVIERLAGLPKSLIATR
jgi:hypothetical protein